MSKVKVLEVIRQGKVGGGESHLISLVSHLDQSRYHPIVLSFTEGPMIDYLTALAIKTYVIPTERAFNAKVWPQVKRILQQEKIDLVHVHGTRAFTNMLWPVWQLRIPIVYTVHGWSFHKGQNFLVKQLRKLFERLFVHRAHHTILVSQSDYATGIECLGSFNSSVITNGVDIKRFCRTAQLKAAGVAIREELKIPLTVLLVGYIARITYQKDPLGMVKGFWQAYRQSSDLQLLMVGEGELKCQTEEKIKELRVEERVYFSDFRQDIPELLAAIDIYCLPSRWEGLPIGLLEAMAMGKAVIATQVNGSKEVIQHEENGLLIDPEQPKALAEAILRLQHDKKLKKKIQQNAVATVAKKYSVARMAQATEAVYHCVSKQ